MLEYLSLPAGHIQAARALMIVSLLAGLGSMIVSLLGLKCIRIGSATEQSKAKIAVTGGILSIIAGEGVISSCSVSDTFRAAVFKHQRVSLLRALD